MSGPDIDDIDAATLADNVQRLEALYLPKLAEHGGSYLSVAWLHEAAQTVRFENLTIVRGLEEMSVLDVGCGLGHLWPFLKARGHAADYLGLDALPAMVAQARALHPEARFEVADINQDELSVKADAVIGSGVITLSEPAVARRTIAAMFRSARIFASFNALSSWNPNLPTLPYRHFDPLEILAFCRTLTPYVLLRHDYSVQDFTVYLFRGMRT